MSNYRRRNCVPVVTGTIIRTNGDINKAAHRTFCSKDVVKTDEGFFIE
jgi:hypothetical protein